MNNTQATKLIAKGIFGVVDEEYLDICIKEFSEELDGVDVMASLCLYYDSVNVYESLRPACIQHWHNMIKINSAAIYKKLAKDIIIGMFWDVANESSEHDRDIYLAIFNQSLNYCIPF